MIGIAKLVEMGQMGDEYKLCMSQRQEGEDVVDCAGTLGVGRGLESLVEQDQRMGTETIHDVGDALNLAFEAARGIADLKILFGRGKLGKDRITDADLRRFRTDRQTGLRQNLGNTQGTQENGLPELF